MKLTNYEALHLECTRVSRYFLSLRHSYTSRSSLRPQTPRSKLTMVLWAVTSCGSVRDHTVSQPQNHSRHLHCVAISALPPTPTLSLTSSLREKPRALPLLANLAGGSNPYFSHLPMPPSRPFLPFIFSYYLPHHPSPHFRDIEIKMRRPENNLEQELIHSNCRHIM
jgi:hypothetical protein